MSGSNPYLWMVDKKVQVSRTWFDKKNQSEKFTRDVHDLIERENLIGIVRGVEDDHKNKLRVKFGNGNGMNFCSVYVPRSEVNFL